MQIIKTVRLIFVCLGITSFVYGQNVYITAPEAKSHLGEKTTVCGKVVSTRFVSGSKGQPTFLNLDKPHRKEILTIVIWGTDRPKFGKPEDMYRNKDVCVTGRITTRLGVPQNMAGAPNQIQSRK